MNEKHEPELRVVEFLLGRLPEAERAALEERYISEPAYLEFIRAIELELIEAYLEGRLTETDRKDFEGAFLATPDRARHVEFMRALLRKQPRKGVNWWAWSSVAACLAVLVAVSVYVQRGPTVSGRPVLEHDRTERKTPVVIDFTPHTGLQRGENTSSSDLVLPDKSVLVRFHLSVTSARDACSAILRDDQGRELLSATLEASQNGVAIFPVQASSLMAGDFIIEVYCSGRHDGTYTFRTVRP